MHVNPRLFSKRVTNLTKSRCFVFFARQADELRAHRREVLRLEHDAATAKEMAATAEAASAKCNGLRGSGGGGGRGGIPGKRGLAMEELFRQR